MVPESLSDYGIPQGPKDPNNKASGPKYHSHYGIWALEPYYLGPWTFRDRVLQVDLKMTLEVV